jgi:hypothetical protein
LYELYKGNTGISKIFKVGVIAVCGIDLVIGVTDKEVSKAEKIVHYNERIHSYLIKTEKGKNSGLNLLINLDPKRQTVL